MKQHSIVIEKFNLKEASTSEIVHQLLTLNTFKAVPRSSTSAKILKSNSSIFAPMLHKIPNENISQTSFLEQLKEGDIT